MESSQLAATSWRGRHRQQTTLETTLADNSGEDDELLAAPRAAAVPDPCGAGRALHQPQAGVLAGPVRHPAPAICGKEPEYWSET